MKLRASVLTTAVIGLGLGAFSGVASAHEAPAPSPAPAGTSGCSNAIAGASENGAGIALDDVTGGDQAFDASNTCNFLNGNQVLSGTNTAGGDITNGDTTTETTDITDTDLTDLGGLV